MNFKSRLQKDKTLHGIADGMQKYRRFGPEIIFEALHCTTKFEVFSQQQYFKILDRKNEFSCLTNKELGR